ncbi:SDR family oxidoreductase, partial [Ruegeria sp.]|uniref:SDR family NAD(P)-dependent oxidoreductase n=1 Tax=Ruegeria sp. TaxID=1879320 RepID=UPI0023287040
MRYANKVALVTGAGHGIGAAIAEKLASEGAAVAVLEINAQTGAAKAKDIEAAGGRACFVEADITDLAQVESAIAETEKALGEVDVLVNNAAYSFAGSLDEIAAELWNREIDVNLNGPYNCIRAVLPAMKARRAGAIVNIASVNGVRYFGSPAYSAAKAAVLNLTQSVASEYGAFGIRCNAVLPGSVRTDAVSWRMRLEKDPQVFEKLAKW